MDSRICRTVFRNPSLCVHGITLPSPLRHFPIFHILQTFDKKYWTSKIPRSDLDDKRFQPSINYIIYQTVASLSQCHCLYLLVWVSFGSFSLRELTCMHCVYLAPWPRKVLCGSFLCAIYINFHSFIHSLSELTQDRTASGTCQSV